MKSKLLFFVIGLIVVGGSIFLTKMLIENKTVPKTDNKISPTLYAKSETALNQLFETTLVYSGRIIAYDEVNLAAEVTGRIMEGNISFQEGQAFKQGDLLIQIFNEDAKAALKASKSTYLQTLSQSLPDINYDFPEQKEKWNTFFRAIDVNTPLPELPEITSDKEEVFLASRGILANYYTIRQQEINIQKYKLYAPFDGYFKNTNQQIGAVATMGASLATIVRSDLLELVVPVPPSDAAKLSAGSRCLFSSSNGIEQESKINRIAQFVDPNTQSVNIYIDYYPKKSGALREGEYVDALFQNSAFGVKIPREAIIDGSSVNTIVENRLVSRPITIVSTQNDNSIISGIEDGDIIVVESLLNVSPSTVIKVRQ